MTKITQLPVATTITDTGVFVIVDQGTSKQLPWQVFKQGGLRGEKGNTGTTGSVGPQGPTGTVATITVGQVSAGEVASIVATTSTVTLYQTVLDFVLPIGPKGDTGTYVPVVASSSVLGGVKIGTGVTVTGDGTISVDIPEYSLPIASISTLGGVKIGEGISISGDGTISATTATPYTLPTASDVEIGGVKIGAGINLTNGVISVTTGAFALQTATNVILGGVKIGAGIDVSTSGTISVSSNVSDANTLNGTTLASNVTASSLTSLGVLTGLTINGLTTLQQTLEVYTTINGATGVITHDCSNSAIFVHNSPGSNWTANFTNISSTVDRVVSVAVLINQGATPYVPTTIQINGAPQTVNWESGVTPTGNANKVDLVNFTFFISAVAVYQVLGNLASFG